MIRTNRTYCFKYDGALETGRFVSKVKGSGEHPWIFNFRILGGRLDGEIVSIRDEANICDDGFEVEKLAKGEIAELERQLNYWESVLEDLDEIEETEKAEFEATHYEHA